LGGRKEIMQIARKGMFRIFERNRFVEANGPRAYQFLSDR
jgi:hypothetical protein